MTDTNTYYQRNRKIILNRAKEYYKNNKEVQRQQGRNKYRKLSEEKNKKIWKKQIKKFV